MTATQLDIDKRQLAQQLKDAEQTVAALQQELEAGCVLLLQQGAVQETSHQRLPQKHRAQQHVADLEQHTARLRALQESLDVKDTVLSAAIAQQTQLTTQLATAQALAQERTLELQHAQDIIAELEHQVCGWYCCFIVASHHHHHPTDGGVCS